MSDKCLEIPKWLIETMIIMNLNNKSRWLILWLLFNKVRNKGQCVYYNKRKLNKECFNVTKNSLTAARSIKILEDLKMVELHNHGKDLYLLFIEDHKKWNVSDEMKKNITQIKEWYIKGGINEQNES